MGTKNDERERSTELDECDNCGYEWQYTGTLAMTTCPNCQRKTTLGGPVDVEEFDGGRDIEPQTVTVDVEERVLAEARRRADAGPWPVEDHVLDLLDVELQLPEQ